MPTKQNTFFSIWSEAHSDDRAVEVSFDALSWFEHATADEIINLLKCNINLCGLGGDYPSDEIALHMSRLNDELAEMFKYIEIRSRVETIGFECYVVDYEAAIKFLCKYRSKIFETEKWREAIEHVDSKILELIDKYKNEDIRDKTCSIGLIELGRIKYLLNLANINNLWGDFDIAKQQSEEVVKDLEQKIKWRKK